MAEADVLAVFSFGAGPGRRVSLTNRQLAKATDRWPDLPVLAQTEVVETLERRGRCAVDVEDDARRRGALPAGAYVDTLMVAASMAQLVTAAGYSRIGVVAHPGHVGRCAALLARRGVEPIIADLTDVHVDFDTSSTQWWTRTQRAWSFRETAVLVHHRILRLI